MDFEWDELKRQATLLKRGIDFADAAKIDPATAFTVEDRRNEYGEVRFVTYGLIDERLHILCWTPRKNRIRVISLRKANDREQKLYGQTHSQ